MCCLKRSLLGFTNNDDDDDDEGRTLKTMVATYTIPPLANNLNISKSVTWLASNNDGNTIIFNAFCCSLFGLCSTIVNSCRVLGKKKLHTFFSHFYPTFYFIVNFQIEF